MTSAPDNPPPHGDRTLPRQDAWETPADRRPGYGSLRLQPVMLGPPPEDDGSAAEDDLDPRELGGRSRTGLIIGLLAAFLLVGAAGGAFLFLRTGEPAQIAAPSAPALPSTPGAPPPAVQAAPAPAPTQPQPTVDMARVDNDLVPPTTDGLSPARRVPAVRILVENDREVVQPR